MMPASTPAPPDVVAAANAASARGAPLRLDVRWYPTVRSTMDIAEEAALAGAPEGVVIVAEEQTHGRGRRGRTWSSPPGAGLYLTIILRPPVTHGTSSPLSLLTLATGVAVWQAVRRATGFVPELKWPNDVMVGPRKLAGILAEGLAIGSAAQTVLAGVGVNLLDAAHPGEVAERATSLQAELGHPVDRGPLLEELLVAIPHAYDMLRCGNTDDILRAWREASPSASGRTVEWQDAGGRHRGVTAGIDQSGALLVTAGSGTARVISGELKWV